MNKKIILPAIVVFSSLLIVAAVAGTVIYFKSKINYASISNGNEIYAQTDTYEITNEELYNKMFNAVGSNYLLEYIDNDLLKDYYPDKTKDSEIIQDKINYLKYGTTDKDIISEYAEEVLEYYEEKFVNNIIFLGYDPSDEDSIYEYIKLLVAKDNYVRDLLINAKESDDYFITEEDVKDYYDNLYNPTNNGILIKFNNEAEAKAAYDKYNLVTLDGNLYLYNGDTPIENVSSDNLIEGVNIQALTDEVAFSYFIKIYNDIYTYRDAIDEESTATDLLNSEDEHFTFDYQKLNTNNSQLATYIFDTLDLDNEEIPPYTYKARKFGSFYYLFYKIDQGEKVEYYDLDANTKKEYKDNLLADTLTEEYVKERIDELRDFDNKLEIVDKILAINYINIVDSDYEYNSKGDKSVLAIYNGKEITADDLFNYMKEKIGVLYAIEISKYKTLLNSTYFETVYGEEKNLDKNESDKMKEHREYIQELHNLFNEYNFEEYGYSPDDYTWNEFIYVYYGVTSEYAIYEQLLIPNTLSKYYSYQNIDYNTIENYLNTDYNNYFSLDVDHLLFYVDFDEDGKPDNFNNYFKSLSNDDQDKFNTMMDALYVDCINYLDLDENNTISDLYEEYTNAGYSTDPLDDDYSIFAQYKAYGIVIKYENLSTTTSLTYDNTSGYATEFVNSLHRLNDKYNLEENLEKEYLVDDQLTITPFGAHLIRVEKGDNFEQPSAKFKESVNDGEERFYSIEAENSNNIPNESQILAYNDIKFYDNLKLPLYDENGEELLDSNDEILYVSSEYKIPTEIISAIEEYYSAIFEDLISDNYFDYSMILSSKADNITFINNNIENMNALDRFADMYLSGLFE